MVAVNVRRPTPDTSFSNKLEKENIPIQRKKELLQYVLNYQNSYFFVNAHELGCNFKPRILAKLL